MWIFFFKFKSNLIKKKKNCTQLGRRFVYFAPKASTPLARHHYRWELSENVHNSMERLPWPLSSIGPNRLVGLNPQMPMRDNLPALCDLSNILGAHPLTSLPTSGLETLLAMMVFQSDYSSYSTMTADQLNVEHPFVQRILAIEKQVSRRFVFVHHSPDCEPSVRPHYRWEAACSNLSVSDMDMPAFQSQREPRDECCDCLAHQEWRGQFKIAPPTDICANERHCDCCQFQEKIRQWMCWMQPSSLFSSREKMHVFIKKKTQSLQWVSQK